MLLVMLNIVYSFVYLARKLCLCIYKEHDKLSQAGGGSRARHRCCAKRNDFLSNVDVELKSVGNSGWRSVPRRD